MTPLTADQPSGAGKDDKQSSVKVGLTSNRRRRPVENDEYASFIRRILRAYSHRVADGDVEALTLITNLADELDAAIAKAVKGLRGCGYSWAEIGSRLGITRQAAQQRWGNSPLIGPGKLDRAIIKLADSPTIYGQLLLVSRKLRVTDPRRPLRRSVHGQGPASL